MGVSPFRSWSRYPILVENYRQKLTKLLEVDIQNSPGVAQRIRNLLLSSEEGHHLLKSQPVRGSRHLKVITFSQAILSKVIAFSEGLTSGHDVSRRVRTISRQDED